MPKYVVVNGLLIGVENRHQSILNIDQELCEILILVTQVTAIIAHNIDFTTDALNSTRPPLSGYLSPLLS